MEENQSTTSSSSGDDKKGLIIATVAVIVILAIAGGGFVFLNKEKNSTGEMKESVSTKNTQTEPASTESPTGSEMMHSGGMMNSFKNGAYSDTGSYVTPGGTESIGVKLTIKDGVVTDASVAQMAKSPTAKVRQADFAANFKSMVIGKDLSTLTVGKVSGSSLTPNGFNDAVDKIKTQAKS